MTKKLPESFEAAVAAVAEREGCFGIDVHALPSLEDSRVRPSLHKTPPDDSSPRLPSTTTHLTSVSAGSITAIQMKPAGTPAPLLPNWL